MKRCRIEKLLPATVTLSVWRRLRTRTVLQGEGDGSRKGGKRSQIQSSWDIHRHRQREITSTRTYTHS